MTFRIGNSEIGKTQAKDLVTPLEIFATSDLSNIALINLARLLQTLDSDSNPENGISLSSATADVLSSVAPSGLNFMDSNFDENDALKSVLASLSIDELLPVSDAYRHLSQSIASQYSQTHRALPIPAFNAHTSGGGFYSNVYAPVDESEEDITIDTLGDSYSSPRYERPYGPYTFFDFSDSVKTSTGIGIEESYIWVDDVLTDNPQIRINLFGLDRTKMMDENLGLAHTLTGVNDDGSEISITVLVDPATWNGSILLNNSVVWDEVVVMGEFNNDADKMSLWLPMSAVNIDYATLSAWKQASIQFRLFNLSDVSASDLDITHVFPLITSSFASVSTVSSGQLRMEFHAVNRRTDYPYDEFGTGCRFASEMGYSGNISWDQSVNNDKWRVRTASFDGELSYKQKPDMVNFDNAVIECTSSSEYTAKSLLRMYQGQQHITLYDVLRLFTPVYNESLYDNVRFIVPDDVIEDPEGHIDDIYIDPTSKTVRLTGHSSCSKILNCYSEPDDQFDWTLSLTPLAFEQAVSQ